MSSDDALHRQTAREVVGRLHRGEVSALELVEAALERIAATEPQINAVPTLCPERARDHARAIMEGRRPAGLLGGLPVAIKDLTDVEGVRTTYGSPIYADHVPSRSSILVERLEARGAIVVGKSNTPEFGAGASTFNEVFGKTRNPWDVSKSVAGSSGGAAAALAAGQVWLATGSDMGGSLRIPASFNGVVGLRPSPGRVIRSAGDQLWQTLAVAGPMARDTADAALLLDAMVGEHPEDPLSLAAPARSFREAAAGPAPARVGYSPDLGLGPVDAEVRALCEAAALRFAELGAVVEPACPDFSGAIEAFQTLRAAYFATAHLEHLAAYRERLKPEIIWNIEKGLALTAADIARAEQARARLYRRVAEFFATYDLLVCPTAIVPPFDVDVRYVEQVEGQRFDNYVDWLGITFVITLTACPALSTPAGFTREGLPVGLQLIGPPRGEAALLAAAARLEELLGLNRALPVDPRPEW